MGFLAIKQPQLPGHSTSTCVLPETMNKSLSSQAFIILREEVLDFTQNHTSLLFIPCLCPDLFLNSQVELANRLN